ncbi:ribbon-helix-helix domain-containing protein [Pseudomonas zeae]|jgi:hypothetical protein|uniref:ribbon-helix-helix domain-containing protein n=1 Tax=Pseudomonas zeae TaxID=2745510 RepID=UPI002147713E|nr:ribbon-helix-helix domain-containing protein [Pseudomonas zeae]UUT14538.1 ribbon-helix-helix domain-containing protein [Pseudomonas zeae]
MLSVRLNDTVRDQLDLWALRTGEPRNSIITKAVTQYLSSLTLGGIPLEESVQENASELFNSWFSKPDEMNEKFMELKRWIENEVIWTKKHSHPETMTGAPTPGIYGRNVVTGYYFNPDREIFVISKHVTWPPASGLDSHHLYVTPYADWTEYMQEVNRKA